MLGLFSWACWIFEYLQRKYLTIGLFCFLVHWTVFQCIFIVITNKRGLLPFFYLLSYIFFVPEFSLMLFVFLTFSSVSFWLYSHFLLTSVYLHSFIFLLLSLDCFSWPILKFVDSFACPNLLLGSCNEIFISVLYISTLAYLFGSFL